MKTSNSQLHFPSEFIQNHPIKLPITSSLKRIGQLFIQFFASSSEPRIWTTTERYGNTFWHVYDPVSDKSKTLRSESEMRVWLEQRYYN